MRETNTHDALFEVACRRSACVSHAGAGRRLALLLPRITPHQFALSQHMSFHRRVKLAAFCAEGQIQLAIKGQNVEVITVRARRRARSTVTGFAEVICPLYAFWRASLPDGARLRRDIPNGPVREQSTR